MKRGIWIVGVILGFLFLTGFVSASCDLSVELINQDPYPAVPGSYVDVLFQMSGTDNSDCSGALFEIIQKYPFSLDKGQEPIKKIDSNTWTTDFKKEWLIPYKLKVDEKALDGNSTLKVSYGQNTPSSSRFTKDFQIKINDVTTDFTIFIKNYDFDQRQITFEVLNHGKNDIDALTLEIPKQENIEVKGSNSNIIGALDSNDFTTTSFEAIPKEGEISLILHYTDEINLRRTTTKIVSFEPEYFEGRLKDENGGFSWVSLIILILVFVVIYYFYKKHRKSKKKKLFD